MFRSRRRESAVPSSDGRAERTPETEATDAACRVLLACRDTSARKWGARWLETEGFQVAFAGDAAEAVTLLRTARPDVIVAEASLRDENGTFLHEILRRLPDAEDLPLVALCGGRKEVQTALEQRGVDVVQKPVDWDIVGRRVRHLLEMSRARGELGRVRTELDEARRFVEATRRRMQQMAFTDVRTGLPNRSVFEQILQEALEGYAGAGGGVAVMYVDVDRFKTWNEALGREGGDEILVQVAQRLRDSIHDSETLIRTRPGLSTSALARAGGDEFTLMLTNVSEAEAGELARQVIRALRARLFLGERQVFVSASVGVAFYPEHGKDAEELVRHAELALCEARRRGGGMEFFYSAELNDQTSRSIEINRLLHDAFEKGELKLHYQPLVSFRDGQVVGAEALLRWDSPELGSVSPAEFVPVAEGSGLMHALGSWTIQTACRQLRSWVDEGLPPIRMAVNLALCQLTRGDLPAVVRETLRETRLEAGWLELELSERGVLRGEPAIQNQLAELKAMGVRLSVDDFGTGESAIAYLKRFPLDCLKIDRSYVDGMIADEDDATITSATIAMAHKLRLAVVAEGVENREQMRFLTDCGCDEYQGFLFSPALPAEEFERILQARREGGGT